MQSIKSRYGRSSTLASSNLRRLSWSIVVRLVENKNMLERLTTLTIRNKSQVLDITFGTTSYERALEIPCCKNSSAKTLRHDSKLTRNSILLR